MENNSLQHHGILGQKWGIRRFQPYPKGYNGSGRVQGEAARETRRRDNVKSMSDEDLQKAVKRSNLERSYKNSLPKDRGETTVDVLNDASRLTNQIRNSANRQLDRRAEKRLTTDISQKTDQELRNAINRATLEKQYTDLFGEETQISKGKRTVLDILDIAGDVTGIAAGSAALAYTIYKIKNRTPLSL